MVTPDIVSYQPLEPLARHGPCRGCRVTPSSQCEAFRGQVYQAKNRQQVTKAAPRLPPVSACHTTVGQKIRGKLHFFGPSDNPQAALQRFNYEWPYLSEGRTPPPADTGDGCTVRDLCNVFLTSKRAQVESGELSDRSFRDYYNTCERLIQQFGRERRVDDLRPDDFERFRSVLTKRLGPVTLRNTITRCRSVFKYVQDQQLIDQPLNFGQSFRA